MLTEAIYNIVFIAHSLMSIYVVISEFLVSLNLQLYLQSNTYNILYMFYFAIVNRIIMCTINVYVVFYNVQSITKDAGDSKLTNKMRTQYDGHIVE